MSSPAVMLASNSRDDLRGDLPDAHGATAAEMIETLDRIARLYEEWTGIAPKYVANAAVLRAASERIVVTAPGFCQCGEFNVFWLVRGGTRIPCASCGARHLTQSESAADLPPADRATAQPPAAEVRANCGAADGK